MESSSSIKEIPHMPPSRFSDDAQDSRVEAQIDKHSWQFWLVFCSLCLLAFAAALEGSVVTAALPTVAQTLGPESSVDRVWITNSFMLAHTVVQPPIAQLCDIFGRRTLLVTIALFAIGSGIAGGSNDTATFITGRIVQGLGSGGIYMLVDLVVCDLVPLRDRGKYLGIVLSSTAFGTTLGPMVAVELADVNWRLTFYVSLPASGVALVVSWFFLDITYEKLGWREALRKIDWIGNTLFIASIASILCGLASGGIINPWNSNRILLPLTLGVAGWIAFHLFEASPWCHEPSVPYRIFASRTSFVGFILAFIAAMVLQWTLNFLPVYFQGVKATSPLMSGVNTLPYNAMLVPSTILAGIVMSKFGAYSLFQSVGFALMAIGVGLLSILDSDSHTALWTVFQLVVAVGQGLAATTILPAIQTALYSLDVASVTGMYAFARSLGLVLGVRIPTLILDAFFVKNVHHISNAELRGKLDGVISYADVNKIFSMDLSAKTKLEVTSVYEVSLQMVWRIAIAFAVLGFIISFGVRRLDLGEERSPEIRLGEKHGNENSVRYNGYEV
ncbi:MFS general substrate transporter [Corynespora cassiicola Philippines]|uniref:MFS general substrate transporter n=1 Tax=Corynespora cassiicola Philippines TaxID=1448308 RepID=A0A2T2NIG0_CORCC|nr:MFS general substrate transporter [Corynespora cassiicola Philippines]